MRLLPLLIIVVLAKRVLGQSCPYGKLGVGWNKIYGESGQPIQLRGMSYYWSQWAGYLYTPEMVRCVRCGMNANIIRAAMAVEMGGYLTNPAQEMQKVKTVVDAAVANNMYVIIDWHQQNTTLYRAQALAFFSQMAEYCGNKCNCIFETYNEPTNLDWDTQLKPYHEALITEIRKYSDGIVSVSVFASPSGQDFSTAVANPIKMKNVVYTLHFYAGSGNNDQAYRAAAQDVLNRGLPLFVSEYGTYPAYGPKEGVVDYYEAYKWWEFLDNNTMSYAHWSIDLWTLRNGAPLSDWCAPWKYNSSANSLVTWMMWKKNPVWSGCRANAS